MIDFDKRNYRKHGDKNKRLINKSLKECGAGRSILLDSEDVIIAGNGVYEQAEQLGLKVRIIESDGSELIAIRRTDINTADEKRKLLALADNHTSDTSEFDMDMIVEDFSIDDLDLWEIEVDSFDCPLLDDIEQGNFIQNIKDASDVFSITFSFNKSYQEQMENFIKANGKDCLTTLIIERVCPDAEAK